MVLALVIEHVKSFLEKKILLTFDSKFHQLRTDNMRRKLLRSTNFKFMAETSNSHAQNAPIHVTYAHGNELGLS